MTALDADRAFALGQVPDDKRRAVGALWRLDAALGAVLASGREPMISQIKLAWWRESLEKLDRERPPAEPMLEEVASNLISAVSGSELAEMEQAWLVLLGPASLTATDLSDYASRGRRLFRYSALLLGGDLGAEQEQAGEGWALVDLARHSSKADAEAALGAARARLRPALWPRPLRPLGMLAALAARDVERGLERLEPHGAPPRIARMLRFRLTGR
jgi:15-cis-phytoene synthase